MPDNDRIERIIGSGLVLLVVAGLLVAGIFAAGLVGTGEVLASSLAQETTEGTTDETAERTTETTEGPAETTVGFPTTTEDASQGGDANVRVAHTSPDAPAVNVIVDGRAIARNVPFENVSEYIAVEPGSHTITILRAANNVSLTNETVTFDAERNYTVAVVGEFSENGTSRLRPVLLRDDAATPPADSAVVRFVHVSPDIGPVDVTINETGRVLFDGSTLGSGTPYKVLPAGDYEFEIRRATEENDGPVLAQFAVSFDADGGYSMLLTGYDTVSDSPSNELLNLVSIVDVEPEEAAESESGEDAEGDETRGENETTREDGTTVANETTAIETTDGEATANGTA